eukprot:TRINITY_DN5444_c0_g1_i1.p1 TRINITY_DN5444_c0_g1~~TRINITY_DN5444_c0_g1_i1.p1  ORF type:complete len:143 (-),score=33.44 TRINITY_DN5444_c0_g1_i1:77-505(-)
MELRKEPHLYPNQGNRTEFHNSNDMLFHGIELNFEHFDQDDKNDNVDIVNSEREEKGKEDENHYHSDAPDNESEKERFAKKVWAIVSEQREKEQRIREKKQELQNKRKEKKRTASQQPKIQRPRKLHKPARAGEYDWILNRD